jgi:DNA invertase Pin-like site-specific DNA recombinase
VKARVSTSDQNLELQERALRFKQMKAEGLGPSAIAKALKIGRASVYRAFTE